MPVRRTALVLAGFGVVFSIVIIARWPAAAQNESPKRKPNEPKPERPGSFAGARAGQTRDDNGLKTTLVWIPPGAFTMGSPKYEKGHFADEDQVQADEKGVRNQL